ncbi:phosphonopyruvate decarboxylase-like [Schistocerca piceifrons]|uniref:phosphonopyruvate decarboxylase-like n=1 Tax=Schistocerca piceifrons TaxID=274613 RepID=UPI001F5F435A|nr:phosphonopyruvate decarboxylase-like [Schistocerca piceifrons]XP_049953710.1 phosphonopyruvate decarboxylase-like [Schistocerca serialis cubense]
MSALRKCVLPVTSKLLNQLEVKCFSTSSALKTDTTTQDLQVNEQTRRNVEVGQLTELVRDFLHPSEFYDAVRGIGIDFFCGVPDSLLKDFCAFVSNRVAPEKHVIAANEGNAISIASGYHLATGKASLVYLQNSGLGNTVNPLVSLASGEVYSIPMLLLIGWRGEPGKRDEPQHLLQGHITPRILEAVGIEYTTLPDYIEGAKRTLNKAKRYMEANSCPYALLVRRQTFLPCKLQITPSRYSMTREMALQIIVDTIMDNSIIVSTTGMLSRELFEYRVSREQGHEKDFLTVGSMGHASTIALGIALQKPSRQVYCLDGDGAMIMHMGALATIGQTSPKNMKHIIFNNGAHDSVGGQQTAARNPQFDIIKICKGNGYTQGKVATNERELAEAVHWIQNIEGPAVLEVKICQGSRKELGRPNRTPLQNKSDFMNFLAFS